jgi:paraquat-inducible protein B
VSASETARNLRVGIFMFAGIFAIGTCAVMLGGQDYFAQKIRFESYFDEAVTGLEVGSPVRFRGVKIGDVISIGLVEDYYQFASEAERLKYGQRVSILMERIVSGDQTEELLDLEPEEQRQRLEENIAQGLRLRLAQAGITGTAFIQADILDPKRYPPMEITHQPRHLYIPSAPSTLSALASAAERFAGRLEDVDFEHMVASIDRLATNLADATENLDAGELQTDAQALITDLRETVAELRGEMRKADLPAVSASAQDAMTEANAALVRVRRMLDGSRYDLELTLENLRVASENMRDVTDTLKSQPSLLLRGQAPTKDTPTVPGEVQQ